MSCNRILGARAALRTVIIIFTLVPGVWAQSKLKTLYKFTGGMDGSRPWALVFDQSGNLYGTTEWGGTYQWGTVFKLTPKVGGGWSKKLVWDFSSDYVTGQNPFAGLVLDKAGNLYGTTSSGGANGAGNIFKVTPNGQGAWSVSNLYSFCPNNQEPCPDGLQPMASLILDPAGNLYGTTIYGGTYSTCTVTGCGAVFKLAPNSDGSWTESVLYGFCADTNCPDGSSPSSNLVLDAAGNLYGTTSVGGSTLCSSWYFQGCGVVFELMPNPDGSWTESVLHGFNGSDGSGPNAGLTLDQAGNLYGTTSSGGSGPCTDFYGKVVGCGTVFELSRNLDGSWTESVLYNFCSLSNCKDGSGPGAGVSLDSSGHLYGTTTGGGIAGHGVVFKLGHTSNGWHERVLYTFLGHPGANPNAALVLDSAGNLYGTTAGDITTIFGTVFEITP